MNNQVIIKFKVTPATQLERSSLEDFGLVLRNDGGTLVLSFLTEKERNRFMKAWEASHEYDKTAGK